MAPDGARPVPRKSPRPCGISTRRRAREVSHRRDTLRTGVGTNGGPRAVVAVVSGRYGACVGGRHLASEDFIMASAHRMFLVCALLTAAACGNGSDGPGITGLENALTTRKGVDYAWGRPSPQTLAS